MAEEKNTIYRSYIEKMTPDFVDPEVRKTLSSLLLKRKELAIGSSSKNTMLILKKTDMLKYFTCIVDGNMIKKSKPDPEVFLKAAMGLGCLPDKAYVIEDSISGIIAAKRGGFTSIGIKEASTYKETDIGISKLSDLLSL